MYWTKTWSAVIGVICADCSWVIRTGHKLAYGQLWLAGGSTTMAFVMYEDSRQHPTDTCSRLWIYSCYMLTFLITYGPHFSSYCIPYIPYSGPVYHICMCTSSYTHNVWECERRYAVRPTTARRPAVTSGPGLGTGPWPGTAPVEEPTAEVNISAFYTILLCYCGYYD